MLSRGGTELAYWWASQGRNWQTAIPQGTLWSRPHVDGARPVDRTALFEMQLDDVVFHYGAPFVRSVSRVVVTCVEAARPPGYPFGPNEDESHTEGWLVRVEPVAVGLQLHRDELAVLLDYSRPGGPLNRNGTPAEKYISRLQPEEARRLLGRLRVKEPTRRAYDRPHEDWRPEDGETDANALARVRREQGHLRAMLLSGRSEAACGICGRLTPQEFLVAGHIVPRSQLTNEERLQFKRVAMLICTFGCDALHERGYTVVDEAGLVQVGRDSRSGIVRAEIAQRVGAPAPAWTTATASMFALHRKTNQGSLPAAREWESSEGTSDV